MSHILIKQPNGKYAVFSTIVDDFTLVDATKEEYIEYELEIEREKLEKHIGKTNETPYYSWNETIAIIERVHGKQHVDELLSDVNL